MHGSLFAQWMRPRLWACLTALAFGASVQNAMAAPPRAEVKPWRGAPCLFVNGQPHPGLMGNSAATGDVTMTGGRCLVESTGSLKTQTARTFPGDFVAEVDGTFLEARSTSDTAVQFMLNTPQALYYLSLGVNGGKQTARFWKWKNAGGGFDLIATPEWQWNMGEAHHFRIERRGDEVVGLIDGKEIGRDQGPMATGEAHLCLSAYRARGQFERLQVTAGGQTLLADNFDYAPEAEGRPNWLPGGGAHLRGFARAGVNLITVTIESSDFWVGEGNTVFTTVDGKMRMVHRQHPQALLLVRLFVRAPGWWMAQHADQAAVTLDRAGEKYPRRWPSPSSQVWRKESAAAVAALLQHWRGTDIADSVLGYAVLSMAAGEWCYGWGEAYDDYSVPQQEGFRAWLKSRYGDDAGLQVAWKTEATLAQAEVPPLGLRLRQGKVGELFDPAVEGTWVRDYLEYHSAAMAQAVLSLAGTVRHEAPGALVGFPYGYHLTDGYHPASYHNTGHRALAAVLASPDVDFLFSPYGYREREPGGYCLPLIPTGSLAAHNKLYYFEDDTRTAVSAPGSGYGRCDTVEQSAQVLWRNAACAVAESGNLWWMDWDEGWYDDPQLWTAMQGMERMAQESVRHDRTRNAEMLVIFSDESHTYFRARERLVDPLLTRQVREVARVGAPFDTCLISDLGRMRDYKLYIFADTIYLSEAERKLVRDKVLQPGKTALWIYAPGLIGEDGLKIGNASSLTGMDLGLDTTTACPLGLVIKDCSHPATRGMPPGLRFGSELNLSPILWCADPQATVLGQMVGTPISTETPVKWWSLWRPGLAVKQVNGANSVFCAVPELPSALVRSVARFAGVHIYDDEGDVLFASAGFLALHTAHGGERLIRLPRPAKVTDAMTGKVVGDRIKEFRVAVPAWETRCWWVD